MTRDQLLQAIIESLAGVANEHPRLSLELGVGERAVVGRISHYLCNFVHAIDTDLYADTEYNIDPNGNRKRLDASPELRAAARRVRRRVYEDGRVVVIPDIVVHARGTNDKNRAAIEVKLGTTGGNAANERHYAELKLQEFQRRNGFRYDFGVLLILPRDWASFTSAQNIHFIPPP